MINAGVARTLVSAGLLVGGAQAPAHEAHRSMGGAAEIPSTDYAFPLPPAGSYRLPSIKAAADGRILDEQGRETNLLDLMRGRTAILSFIYTRCGDICPTATARLALLQDLTAKHPELVPRMRLVTMSFDPGHDTPEVMAGYAAAWRSTDPHLAEWRFVTARDADSLRPILAAYNQSVVAEEPPNKAGALSHILRVFLIDSSGTIRNIYSLDFLDPYLVLNDIRSLQEPRAALPGGSPMVNSPSR